MDLKRLEGAQTTQTSHVKKGKTPRKQEAPRSANDSVTLGNSENDIQPLKPKAKWLFLNYIAADCNLTEYQMKNIDQMERVGSDANTHIVAYIDVGPKPNPLGGEWQGCKAFYVTKDATPDKLGSEVVGEYGDHIDMSNPQTLTKFLIDAVKKFPAENVALILNDHGGGFTGAMSDDTDGSFMSTPQLNQALADAEKVTGKKIAIVGFDACLMGEAEVAYEIKDRAGIMLGSEENEGGPGWTYDSMLGGKTLGEAIKRTQKQLFKGIDVGPKEFAKIVVDVNREHNNDIPTFSAMDLTRMDAFAKASDTMAESLIKTTDKEAIRKAIGESESYGGGWTPYKDIHDVDDMCAKIAAATSDKAVKKAAETLKAAVQEVVFANESNPQSHPNSKGISIYTPTTIQGDIGYDYDKLMFAQKTKWDEAIKALAVDKGGTPPKTPGFWPDKDHTPRKPKKT